MQSKFPFVFTNIITSFLCTALIVMGSANICPAIPQKKSMVVVVDPGHGGPALGAKGAFALEKDVVLKVAKKLGVLVAKTYPDVKIIYTRTTDTLVSLEDRGALANKVGADLFLSIHANANPNKGACGTETWVMGLDKTDKNMNVAMKENAEIVYENGYEKKYEGYDPKSPESFIMFSFIQNAHMEQSLTFASLIETEYTSSAKRKSRGVHQGPFLVLWKATMPSVLTEIGFISNSEEEKYIGSDAGQEAIAQSLLQALGEYKKKWERNNIVGKSAAEEIAKSDDDDQPAVVPAKATNSNPPAKTNATAASKPNNVKNTKPAATLAPKKENTKSTSVKADAVTYHVQIFSTNRELAANAKEFKGLKNVRYYRYGQAYRYYVGNGKNEQDAVKILRETQKKFPKAFTIKLRNGKSDN